MRVITTSWDDGHILDFKLAGLLAKYNLPSTFYIPQSNAERPVMSGAQIRILSKDFEIGGHGISHSKLNSNDEVFLKNEVEGSFRWLHNLLGYEPVSFCFPGGVYNKKSLQFVFKTGYKLARSTELLSTRVFNSNNTTPTTLQVYSHSKFVYTKHLLKRKKGHTFIHWLKNKSETDLYKLTEYYLNEILTKGGCLHIWGHSWEIEKYSLWQKLENIFKYISNKQQFSYMPNKGLAQFK